MSRLAGLLELTELIIDALAELLSAESRYAKFRPAEVLPVAQGRPMPVEAMLSEVQRRHEVQRQLAAVLTPDTAVARQPSLDPPAAQVSPTQWSLLARADDGTTPRGLAMQLGRSVFGTTIEVYRLLELGLLVVPGRPPAPADGRPLTGISFIRAASGERGSDALPVVSERPIAEELRLIKQNVPGAAGGPVIVAVLGTSELNVAMLHFQARKMIDRIAEHSAGLARGPRADPAVAAPPGQDGGPAGDKPLPARRPARRPRGK
jgi:hypothetical protein